MDFSTALNVPQLLDPLNAEIVGNREILSWLKDANMANIIVESDCQVVVNGINQNSHTEIHSSYLLFQDCATLLFDHVHVSLVYVPRSANLVAHLLARASGSLLGKTVWCSFPPQFLCVAIAADGSLN